MIMAFRYKMIFGMGWWFSKEEEFGDWEINVFYSLIVLCVAL